jgi:hypothetical protein
MNIIPVEGDMVVYANPPEGGSWRLPALGTIFVVTNVATNQGAPYPTHIRVRTEEHNNSEYSNTLIPEFLEFLNPAREARIVGKKRNTKNCCWTCMHLGTPECALRRKKAKCNRPCVKPLSSERAGHLKCAGSKSGLGCETDKLCWERYPFGTKRRTPQKRSLQHNLIFPKAPTG